MSVARRRFTAEGLAALRAAGRRGGAARRDKLTPERRSEIARAAARARWKSDDEEVEE